jgi:cold shock CspA family protein
MWERGGAQTKLFDEKVLVEGETPGRGADKFKIVCYKYSGCNLNRRYIKMSNTALLFGNPGVVQSYDSSIGEGVVISERTGASVRLTENRLRAIGLTTIKSGARILYSVKSGRSTLLVDRIYEVDGVPTRWFRAFDLTAAKPITIDGQTWVEGKVESIAPTRRFAFILSEGLPQIFVGADTLQSVVPRLSAEDRVEVECGLTPKGLCALNIRRPK